MGSTKTRSSITLRRNLLVLLVVGSVLVATVVWLGVFLSSKTLSYEGKPISQWLAWFDSSSGLSREQWQERMQKRSEAAFALRQMGSDVIPYLRRMLKPAPRSTRLLDKWIREIRRDYDQVGVPTKPPPEEARMLRAVEACSALGRDAQALVPDLLLVLKSNSYSNVRSRAAYALGNMAGAPAEVVPALVQSLSNHLDCNILIALGKYGVDSASAVPAIVTLLDGIEKDVSEHKPFDRNALIEAARALHQIAPKEAEKRLPLLRQVLQEEQDPFWQPRLATVVGTISSGTPPNGQEH